jgi:hypothetical protein
VEAAEELLTQAVVEREDIEPALVLLEEAHQQNFLLLLVME